MYSFLFLSVYSTKEIQFFKSLGKLSDSVNEYQRIFARFEWFLPENVSVIAVKSLPRVREKIEHFKQEALHWDIVKHVELYATSNPYFSRYPRSSAMKLQLPVDTAEFEKALADALALDL